MDGVDGGPPFGLLTLLLTIHPTYRQAMIMCCSLNTIQLVALQLNLELFQIGSGEKLAQVLFPSLPRVDRR